MMVKMVVKMMIIIIIRFQTCNYKVRESESHSVMSNSLWPHGLYSPWNCPGQNTGVGSLSLLQGVFPTQGSNPGLPHCRQILDQLSHQGSPRTLPWVSSPFSRGSSQPRDGTQVSRTAGRFLTSWATRETLLSRHIIVSRSIRAVACVSCSCSETEQHSIPRMHHTLLIDSSVDGHVGWFCLLDAVSHAFMTILQVLAGAPVFSFSLAYTWEQTWRVIC